MAYVRQLENKNGNKKKTDSDDTECLKTVRSDAQGKAFRNIMHKTILQLLWKIA